MDWFNNLRLLWKVLAGFLSVAIMMAVLGIFSIYELARLDETSTEMATNWLPSTYTAGVLDARTADFRTAQFTHTLSVGNTEMAATERQMDDLRAQVADALTRYEPLVASPRERELFDAIRSKWAQYLNDHDNVFLPLSRARRTSEAVAYLNGDAATLYDDFTVDMINLVKLDIDGGTATSARASSIYTEAERLIFGAIVVAVLVALGLGWFVARRITNAIGGLAAAARRIAREDLPTFVQVATAMAEGDLTQDARVTIEPVDVHGKDEIGQMADDVNQMIVGLQQTGAAFTTMSAGLRELVGQVYTSAVSLAETSGELGNAAQQTGTAVQHVTDAIQGIARGAGEQAMQVEQASAAANLLESNVEQVAANATAVAATSDQTRASAQHGAEAVRETVEGMTAIQQVVTDAAATVEELGKLGDKIGAVVETIDDIAEQTNLLALNAAIEAARAGEHGRGFAVVADEVRKLAERSQRETKVISDLITQVQSGTRQAVMAMEAGTRQVAAGAQQADQAGRALSEILTAVEATAAQITDIAGAAQQMAPAASSGVEAMVSISAVVEENSAATEEVSASAEEMSAQIEEMSAQAQELAATAEQLRQLVSRFRLESNSGAARAGQPLRSAA